MGTDALLETALMLLESPELDAEEKARAHALVQAAWMNQKHGTPIPERAVEIVAWYMADALLFLAGKGASVSDD